MTDEEYAAGYVLGRCGEPEQARRFAKGLEERSDNYAQTIAAFYAGAGDRMNTLRWLEESFRRREPLLASIAVDPSWEALRSEPRFLALLQKDGPPGERIGAITELIAAADGLLTADSPPESPLHSGGLCNDCRSPGWRTADDETDVSR